jgi:altronate dehydratase small subunit
MTAKGALVLSERDNVATLLEDATSGSEVMVRLGKESNPVKALEEITFGFKIAVADIVKGGSIIKYGEPIGLASRDIKKGELVHIHNLEGARGRGDLEKGDLR